MSEVRQFLESIATQLGREKQDVDHFVHKYKIQFDILLIKLRLEEEWYMKKNL